MGYHRAGFDVTGVDIEPQPNYPFAFFQANALEFPLDEFDFIHASPPCQHYSLGAQRWKHEGREYPDLVAATRERLIRSGKPYVIENVVGAPLINPITLCGTQFGLKVIRHRIFESNIPLQTPPHHRHIGTVKGGEYVTVAGHGGDGSGKYELWCEAMGIDWMTKQELTQAVPPAYAEFIGKQVMSHLIKASEVA